MTRDEATATGGNCADDEANVKKIVLNTPSLLWKLVHRTADVSTGSFLFLFFSKASPGVDDVTEGAAIDLWALNLWLPTCCQQHLLFLESGEEHRWSHFTISWTESKNWSMCPANSKELVAY